MPPSRAEWSTLLTILLLAGALLPLAAAEPATLIPALTNLAQLRRLAGEDRRQVCSYRLEGIVRAVDRPEELIFLEDDSGAEVIEVNWGDQPIRAGQRLRLQVTYGSVTATEFRLRLSKGPIAGSDFCHPMLENSGEVFLKAGRHPLRVAWFNWTSGSGLEVDYAGPDRPRQRIPETALFREEPDPSGDTRLVNGLRYRCFEGDWVRLPDFRALVPVKTGVTSGFHLGVKSRAEHVGLEFAGLLEVPRDGLYRFFVTSDDGCQLFLPEALPKLTILDSVPLPLARRLAGNQSFSSESQASQWLEVEGELAFVNQRGAATELELIFGGGRLLAKVLNAAGGPPAYLMRSRVRATGVCQATATEDGRVLAGALVVPGWEHFQVIEVAPTFWAAFPEVKVGALLETNVVATAPAFHLRGKLRARPDQLPLFEDDTGIVPVELFMPLPANLDGEVELLCRWRRGETGVVLHAGVFRARPEASEAAPPLTVLTTAEQVQRLNRQEAARQYPVRLQGVLTWVSADFWAAVIQDATRAIYVRNYGNWPLNWPEPGEFWQIEGVSDPADFSPVVEARSARRLGLGRLPEPLHPTWDQLLSGTLDAQYVELQGIVTAVEAERVTLLTRAGRLTLALFDHSPPPPESLKHALIRVRGCLFPQWDWQTHRVQVHRPMRMGGAALTVDEPPPLDPFVAVKKSAAQLLSFDAEAGAFQRVKVTGQFLHERAGHCFLMDGTNGLRFVPREKTAFQPGDQVEVVGFPELAGPSPVLREAVARKTGSGALPEPHALTPEDMIHDDHDATLVRVEGVLVNRRESRNEQVLEIQAGLRIFMARLAPNDPSLRALKTGSRLELTGVYSGLGGNRIEGREIDSFELLLNSPAAVRVLATPPWWTLKRLLILISLLLGILALTLVWIKQLRRKVEERTAQLGREIEERERVEQHRLMERERARVAQDLHDELGSGLTEVSILGSLARNASIPPEQKDRYLDQLTEAARSLVTGLDEIVWAVNPQYDSTASLATYYSLFAQRFLNLAGIACRLQVSESVAEHPLESKLRHGIFLAFKEALNNVVRHSGATEVRLAIAVTDEELRISIADNGRGFGDEDGSPGKDGLAGLRQRMEKLGGHCDIRSQPDEGTTVEFRLPLREKVLS